MNTSRLFVSPVVRNVLAFALVASGCSVLHAQVPGLGRTGTPGARGGGLGVGSYDTKTRATPDRVITGTVVDKDGKALKGAIVYLKDDKTEKVKSVTADDDGKFRFGPLSRSVDYKLWAQDKEKKSAEKPISSLDTTDEIKRNLTIQ